NVARVVGRIRLGTDEASRLDVARAASAWIDHADPGAWNQALMDLGREVCRPRPRCDACPLRRACRFRTRGAIPAPLRRRQSPYAGSRREARGAVVRALRESDGAASLASIARLTGVPIERIAAAVGALVAEGVVAAGPAALAGRPGGRVRFSI